MTDETSVVRNIGRYHVLDELGRGGMGVVYRSFDPVIRRTVALKTIACDSDSAEGRALRERLHREAAAAGTLTHPNIVTIYDIVEDGSTTAVAMEYVEGQTLSSLLGQLGAIPFDQALSILEQVCSALDYAGSRGIVHRDIKPANILLMPDGRPKILDFGIARIAMSGTTQTGTIMGSPSYMSPEQVRGLPLDARSDLFSAAVVFYEMLTRERPFESDDIATTMFRIVHEPPRAIERVTAGISPAVVGVLESALAKDPALRFQSGSELVEALRRAQNVDGQPVISDGTPAAAAVESPADRRPRILVAGLIGSGVLLVAVILMILFGVNSGTQIGDSPASAPPYSASGTGSAPAEAVPATSLASTSPGPVQRPSAPPSAAVSPVARQAADASTPTSAVQAKLGSPPAATSSTVPPAPAPAAPSAAAPVPVAISPAVTAPAATPPVVAPRAAPPPADAPVHAVPTPATPPVPGTASLRVDFAGQPYPVTLFAGDTQLDRVESASTLIPVEPGSVRIRAVNESLFLNADLGMISLKPGERRSLSLPGTASAVLGVRGEDYAGVRLVIDGRPVPGPYPAQIGRIAAGAHRVIYRWTTGPAAGREISDNVTLSADGHFRVQAVLADDKLVVQQLR